MVKVNHAQNYLFFFKSSHVLLYVLKSIVACLVRLVFPVACFEFVYSRVFVCLSLIHRETVVLWEAEIQSYKSDGLMIDIPRSVSHPTHGQSNYSY